MVDNAKSLKIRILTGLAAGIMLCAGCAQTQAPAATQAAAPTTTVSAIATPEPLPAADETAVDDFCARWNDMMSEEAVEMNLDPAQVILQREDSTLQAGTRTAGLKAGVSSITLYLNGGQIVAADCTTLTRDWKSGGNGMDPAGAREWDACWKTMVLCLNNNAENVYSPALLTDIATGMPPATDVTQSVQGEIVEDNGWEYRMASLERNAGVMYEKRVRACSMEYADAFSSWISWL